MAGTTTSPAAAALVWIHLLAARGAACCCTHHACCCCCDELLSKTDLLHRNNKTAVETPRRRATVTDAVQGQRIATTRLTTHLTDQLDLLRRLLPAAQTGGGETRAMQQKNNPRAESAAVNSSHPAKHSPSSPGNLPSGSKTCWIAPSQLLPACRQHRGDGLRA